GHRWSGAPPSAAAATHCHGGGTARPAVCSSAITSAGFRYAVSDAESDTLDLPARRRITGEYEQPAVHLFRWSGLPRAQLVPGSRSHQPGLEKDTFQRRFEERWFPARGPLGLGWQLRNCPRTPEPGSALAAASLPTGRRYSVPGDRATTHSRAGAAAAARPGSQGAHAWHASGGLLLVPEQPLFLPRRESRTQRRLQAYPGRRACPYRVAQTSLARHAARRTGRGCGAVHYPVPGAANGRH